MEIFYSSASSLKTMRDIVMGNKTPFGRKVAAVFSMSHFAPTALSSDAQPLSSMARAELNQIG